MDAPSPHTPEGSLRELHEQYIDAVNRAVAEDRADLVGALASAYPDEAAALMSRLWPAAA